MTSLPRPPRTVRDAPLRAWFAQQGWTPAAFQREVWARYLRGESGLLVTPTGSGKTLAAIGGPLLEALAQPPLPRARRGQPKRPRLRVLWVTPLRALASDTAVNLQRAIDELEVPWTVATRTGDASAKDKRLARQGQAELVVITPESLALQMSYGDTETLFVDLQAVIVDEWHELLDNKRGVLLQLALARLRRWQPALRCWGLSATLGNLDHACDVLLPHQPDAAIVRGRVKRPVHLRTLIPAPLERFPWGGHLGLAQLPAVYAAIGQAAITLLFTNTRAQAELWHQALSSVWLDDPSTLALHHGSLSATLRGEVENALRRGQLRCVVATSSLDLGVDFPAVDQVIQLGSPKGVAKLLQRAGRARHRPGESGDMVGVPTHALELLDYAAARQALAAGDIEPRFAPTLSLDVLAQHCVTIALGGGFEADALLAEVRSTWSFAQLTPSQWQAVLEFVVQGGRALQQYPAYRRVEQDGGHYTVTDRRIALLHRLSIGTIASDGHVLVRFLKGGTLGSVEESFIGRLRPGDRFQFGGRTLELAMLKDMTAYVRLAGRGDGSVPRWQGGRLPLSTQLGRHALRLLGQPDRSPEMLALQPLLATQHRLSHVPGTHHPLAELLRSRNGHHLCIYLFAGRAVHEGIATVLALRLGRRQPNTFAFAVNDYGLILTAPKPFDVDATALQHLVAPEQLAEDLSAGANLGELARRQFREVARVAGLLPPSLPGRAVRSVRQLQASAGLLYDVLMQHDPGHILLAQAQREVLEHTMVLPQITEVLRGVAASEWVLTRPPRLTPFAFPLWAESLRGHLSTEDWKTRVMRAAAQLERRNG